MEGLYESESWLQIALVTGAIGGGAAWLTGRATAATWRPFWHVVAYTLLLGCAVRFVHFALFDGTLISPASYAADTIYLLSDGEPSAGRIRDLEGISREIKAQNRVRGVTIHCIAFGEDSELLKRLAKENGGEFRFVDQIDL